jgi:hypothetical protein
MAKSPKPRYQFNKRGTAPQGKMPSDEQLRPNIPTRIIKLDEERVTIEIDFNSHFEKGEMKKERGIVKCFKSQVNANIDLYEKQGKNPKVVS